MLIERSCTQEEGHTDSVILPMAALSYLCVLRLTEVS